MFILHTHSYSLALSPSSVYVYPLLPASLCLSIPYVLFAKLC